MIGAIMGYIILGIIGGAMLCAIVWSQIQVWCKEVFFVWLITIVTTGLIVLGVRLIVGPGAF